MPTKLASRPSSGKQNAPVLGRGVGINSSGLEQVPQELVVDLVMELDFLRFDEGSEGAGTAVCGRLLQVGVAGFYVFAEKRRRPFGFAEICQRVVDVVGQVALRKAEWTTTLLGED